MKLYKIIKKEYYDRALNYGDLCFQSPEYASNCNNINKDENEKDSSVVVYNEQLEDTKIICSKSKVCFSYCFTTDYDKYLTKYELKFDEVILEFDFYDILDFFRSLDLACVVFGDIIHSEDFSFDDNGLCNLSILSNRFMDKYEIDCLLRTFIKRQSFKEECEFRFTCLPYDTDYLMYYHPSTNMLFGIYDEKRYSLSDRNFFIKLQPLKLVADSRLYVNYSVQKLFKRAVIVKEIKNDY